MRALFNVVMRIVSSIVGLLMMASGSVAVPEIPLSDRSPTGTTGLVIFTGVSEA